MLALLTVRIPPLFWLFVVAFNLVGAVDIIIDYYHGNQVGLAALAGLLTRSRPSAVSAGAGHGTAS